VREAVNRLLPFTDLPSGPNGTLIDPQDAAGLDAARQAMTGIAGQLKNLDVIVDTITPDAWQPRQDHGHGALRKSFLDPADTNELKSGLEHAARQAERLAQIYTGIHQTYERSVAAYRREAAWQVPGPHALALVGKLTGRIAAPNLQSRITFALERAGLDGSVRSVCNGLRNFAAELDPERVASDNGLPDPAIMGGKPQRLTGLLRSLKQVRETLQELADSADPLTAAKARKSEDPVSELHQAIDQLHLAQVIATDTTPASEVTATIQPQLKEFRRASVRLSEIAWTLRTPADVSQMAEENLNIKEAAEALQTLHSQHPGLQRAHDIAVSEMRRQHSHTNAAAAVTKVLQALSSGERLPFRERSDAVIAMQTLDHIGQEASNAETWWNGLTHAEQAAIIDPVRIEMAAAGIDAKHIFAVIGVAKYHAYAEANPHVQDNPYKQSNLRLREIRTEERGLHRRGLKERLTGRQLNAEKGGITGGKQALQNDARNTAVRLRREATQNRVSHRVTELRGKLAADRTAVAQGESRLSQAAIGTTADEASLAREVADRLAEIGKTLPHLETLAERALEPAGDGRVIDDALRFAESATQQLGEKASWLREAAQRWQDDRRAGAPGDAAVSAERLDKALYQVDDQLAKIRYQAWRHFQRLMSPPERQAGETVREIGDMAGKAGTWDPTTEQRAGFSLPQRRQLPFQRMLTEAGRAQQELGKLAHAVKTLKASAAQGDHVADLRKLPATEDAASTLREAVNQAQELVSELTRAVSSGDPAAADRAGRSIQAVIKSLTRLTGNVRRMRTELETHLATGLPAQIKELRETVAKQQLKAHAVVAQLSRLRDAAGTARAANPAGAPSLPAGLDLSTMSDLAEHVTRLVDLLAGAARDFAIGGARRSQGLLGLGVAGIPSGTGEAVHSVRRATAIINDYTRSLEQIRDGLRRALDHAAYGRVDEAATESQSLQRQLSKLRPQLTQQGSVFEQAMSASGRLMLPAPRGLADLAAAAGHGATSAAPAIHDALEQVRATHYQTEASALEGEIHDAGKRQNQILRVDEASPFFSPLTKTAMSQATIVEVEYLPLHGLRGAQFEHPFITPREGELGLPWWVRLSRHPGDLLRAALSVDRSSRRIYGAAKYKIRLPDGTIYTEWVSDQRITMDRGPSWITGRDINERAFAHAWELSHRYGSAEIVFTPVETRTDPILLKPALEYEWTRHARVVTIDGMPLRWRSSVEETPYLVVPEPSVQAVQMARGKFEVHLHWDAAVPFLGHIVQLLPKGLGPELYSNARIAVNKKVISQIEIDQLRQIRSLADALNVFAGGSTEKDSLQIEVSVTVLRVQLIPQRLLEKVPFLGSEIFDLTYLRIGEFKLSFDGAAAQDILVWLLEHAPGGVLLSDVPRTRLAAPALVADLQRPFIDPLDVAEEISGRPGDHTPMTPADRQLQYLRGNVSGALDLLSRGAGTVATNSFRYADSILRSAGLLDGAVSEGSVDPARAQRIRDLAAQSHQLAHELAGPVKAEGQLDAPGVFAAKRAGLHTRLEEISNLVRGTPPSPGGGTSPVGGTPSKVAAVQPVTTAAASPNAATQAQLVPAMSTQELSHIGALVQKVRARAASAGTGPGVSMSIDVPGFGPAFAAAYPASHQALLPGRSPGPGTVGLEVADGGAAASLAEIRGAFHAMAAPPTGVVVIAASGAKQAAADFARLMQAEFPGVRFVIV
jgi:hypothetical protein